MCRQVSRSAAVPTPCLLWACFLNCSEPVRSLPSGTVLMWPAFEEIVQDGSRTHFNVTTLANSEEEVASAQAVLRDLQFTEAVGFKVIHAASPSATVSIMCIVYVMQVPAVQEEEWMYDKIFKTAAMEALKKEVGCEVMMMMMMMMMRGNDDDDDDDKLFCVYTIVCGCSIIIIVIINTRWCMYRAWDCSVCTPLSVAAPSSSSSSSTR